MSVKNGKSIILNHPVIGNYFSDHKLFSLIDSYAHNSDNSWKDRADVQEFLEVTVMGMQSTRKTYKNDEAYVQVYLDGC